MFNTILNYVRSKKDQGFSRIALALASAGIAALLLDVDETVHNRFSLGINVDEDTRCTFADFPKSAMDRLLKKAKIIIWDEATMVT